MNFSIRSCMVMNGYKYTKNWFVFCASKEECTPIHTALYLWLVEQNNLSGWHCCFPADTLLAMKTLHIRSAKTYRKVFDSLVEWGILRVIHKAKNQHACSQVALVDFTQADENAGVNSSQAEGFGQVNSAGAEVKITQAGENAGVFFTAANELTYSKTNINIKPVIKQERENTCTHEEKNQKKNPLLFPEEEKKKSCAKKRKETSLREAEFQSAVFSFSKSCALQHLQAFYDYWSEPDSEGNMRWELERTWELGRRIAQWMRRENQFNHVKTNKNDGYHTAETLDYNIPL